MANATESVICAQCGQVHDIGDIEVAYGLPDDYFSLSEQERETRGKASADFCQLDERYFIRAVIPIPMLDRERYYCWGAWVEISRECFRIAYDTWEDEDVSHIPRLKGQLANRLHEYKGSAGLIGELELRHDSRPFFYVLEESRLKDDQQSGITSEDATRYYHFVA